MERRPFRGRARVSSPARTGVPCPRPGIRRHERFVLNMFRNTRDVRTCCHCCRSSRGDMVPTPARSPIHCPATVDGECLPHPDERALAASGCVPPSNRTVASLTARATALVSSNRGPSRCRIRGPGNPLETMSRWWSRRNRESHCTVWKSIARHSVRGSEPRRLLGHRAWGDRRSGRPVRVFSCILGATLPSRSARCSTPRLDSVSDPCAPPSHARAARRRLRSSSWGGSWMPHRTSISSPEDGPRGPCGVGGSETMTASPLATKLLYTLLAQCVPAPLRTVEEGFRASGGQPQTGLARRIGAGSHRPESLRSIRGGKESLVKQATSTSPSHDRDDVRHQPHLQDIEAGSRCF